MWNYTDEVYDHFMNPRNVGVIEDPDGLGEVGSMACGDALRLSFKLDDDGKIADAKFQTFGCGSAIASSSILTEMIMGLSLEDAAQITNEDIAAKLGGLPREKMHCSVMGREALEEAMKDYFQKKGLNMPCTLVAQSVMICSCFQVTKDTIVTAIRNNDLETVEDVTNFTKAGGGCTECHHDIEHLIQEVRQESAEELVAIEKAMPESELVKSIRDVLENDVASALHNDGGDIKLVRVEDDKRVYVRLMGACAACRAADVTIKGWVEKQLRLHVSEDLEVIEVTS